MGGTSYGQNDYSAANLLAQVTQGQWKNYQALINPVEDQAIQYATNPQAPLNAAQAAGVQAQQVAQSRGLGLQKGLETAGINLTPAQKQDMDRKTNTSNALAQVNAMNKAGIGAYDTQTQVLTGQPSSIGIASAGTVSQNPV